MSTQLNPYLNFDGNAREAMEFYRQVFGGELSTNTYGEFGDPGAEGADKIMHGMLVRPDGFALMGADNPPGAELQPGNTMTVCLSGDDVDALRGYWAQLSDDAEVSTPLEKQMWGDEYGMCTDRFGVPWMVNISQPATG